MLAGALAALCIAVVVAFGAAPTTAQPSAAPADPRPVRVAVMISSDKPPATGPEEVHAIRDFVGRRVRAINDAGGVKGRRLEALLLDDMSDVERTKSNVERVLGDSEVVAMIGIWNSTRGAAVVRQIGGSGLPFISEMSVETLFADHPDVYTLTRSVADEQEVFQAFARDRFKRIAVIGDEDDLYTRAYVAQFMASGGELVVTGPHWIKGNIDTQTEAADRIVAAVRDSGADGIFLSLGSKRGAAFLSRLRLAGVKLPVFIGLGSISGTLADASGGGRDYEGPLFEIAEGGIANLNNERLEQLMRKPETLGGGRRYSEYAVGYGARYADLVALVADAAASSAAPTVANMRRAVAQRLASLGEGRRVWRGWAQDWSFSKQRASAERSLIVFRAPGESRTLLAPMQYVRAGGRIQRIPVLNVHVDMTRIYGADSSAKSFEAEFFMTLKSVADVPISVLEFTNAVRGPGAAAPLINVREVHSDRGAGLVDGDARVYKVSGRFMFEPDLAKYPFDQQIFSISFQPASTSSAFLLQPPSESLRNQAFAVDGWRIESHYVGSNDRIIRSIGGPLNEERVIPYYNFNYTWVMKRQVVDYVLRVIVPLSFIMVVAYIANFIPRSEFESIVAIQVTALLSAIALYLALNQPQADGATLSDVIFVVAYASISIMIALSVFEVNTTLSQSPAFMRAVHVVQIYLVPAAAVGLIVFVVLSAAGVDGMLDAAHRLWSRAVASAAVP
jgi:ABC-type branched-subunit amino acid transport system substrate-binding protein